MGCGAVGTARTGIGTGCVIGRLVERALVTAVFTGGRRAFSSSILSSSSLATLLFFRFWAAEGFVMTRHEEKKRR
jgi:hypothetical protein